MSRTLVGIVSYGGLPFLELALKSIQETATKAVDIRVVTAKPGDTEMSTFLFMRGIPQKIHTKNKGFPASVNDLYDAAFVGDGVNDGQYDHLIICGNDVVVMPGAIDAMINCAERESYEMVCGSEFNSRFLVENYPEARQFFHGENLIFTDFNARPWELHKERRTGIEPHQRKDIRNFTLFKRSAFEKVGYADVGFVKNGYYEDNQFCERCDHLGVSACGLLDAPFFHFWSRSIHQNVDRDHGKWFGLNKERFDEWKANPVWKIDSREHESETIARWNNR